MQETKDNNRCSIEHAPCARETARRMDEHFEAEFGISMKELFGAGDGGDN